MKLKTIVILLILLGALALAAYFAMEQNAPVKTTGDMGERLFENLPLEKLAGITIKSVGETIHLKKKQSLWVVEEQFDYPADFPLITALITKLVDAKTGRRFEASRDAILRLGLASPEDQGVAKDSQGVEIELRDDEDTLFLRLILGKTREVTAGAGGHYLMMDQDPVIHLVDQKFDALGTTSFDWIRKNLLDIKAENIEKIFCFATDGSPVYALIRPEKNQWPTLVGQDAGMKLDQSKLDDLLTPLSPLGITGVFGASEDLDLSLMSFTHGFEYHLYDQTVIRVSPGKILEGGEEKYVIQAKVLAFPPEPGPASLDAKDPLHKNMDQWVCKVPQWKYKRFIPRVEDLFEKK
ncbi:MAG: DUF4340 domain-containing protein [Proteobacteria bacterium]|nr:DUF4340 domain-containing protein [Pseudomonadota bacterium]